MKKILSLLLVFFCLFAFAGVSSAKDASPDGVLRAAGEILLAKKRELGIRESRSLFSGSFSARAGSTAGDWYAFGAARLGLEDGSSYARSLLSYVGEAYETPEKLSRDKATEWHRISLCLAALGYDPAAVETGKQTVNLISDGVLYRENIGRQGINGVIWGLITLAGSPLRDTENAPNTMASLKELLLSSALPSGGWALSGSEAETDLTAMALTALALTGKTEPRTEEMISSALTFLRSQQNADGSFSLRGLPNCESTAWALIALCSLEIDCKTDPRFIKNGNTVLDGLFSFRTPAGAFVHSRLSGEAPDDMSGAQALLALAALFSFETGQGNLFDFSAAALKKADAGGLSSLGKALARGAETIKTVLADAKTRNGLFAAALFAAAAGGTAVLYRRRKRK